MEKSTEKLDILTSLVKAALDYAEREDHGMVINLLYAAVDLTATE